MKSSFKFSTHANMRFPDGEPEEECRRRMNVKKAKEARRRRSDRVEYVLLRGKATFRNRERLVGYRVRASPKMPRSLVEFLFLVLQQHTSQRGTVVYLFDYRKFSQAHFLELGIGGSGTRLVALALGHFVRKYTATDIPALVLLLRKNILSRAAPATVTVLTGLFLCCAKSTFAALRCQMCCSSWTASSTHILAIALTNFRHWGTLLGTVLHMHEYQLTDELMGPIPS
ncbi:hypothetical protein EDB85DRAFT_2274987 [Lactarius pseudohatsudake]|nr:hypothetical protein EDB85DRAFT_2274987 [Lactarius pseudohatsudake]